MAHRKALAKLLPELQSDPVEAVQAQLELQVTGETKDSIKAGLLRQQMDGRISPALQNKIKAGLDAYQSSPDPPAEERVADDPGPARSPSPAAVKLVSKLAELGLVKEAAEVSSVLSPRPQTESGSLDDKLKELGLADVPASLESTDAPKRAALPAGPAGQLLIKKLAELGLASEAAAVASVMHSEVPPTVSQPAPTTEPDPSPVKQVDRTAALVKLMQQAGLVVEKLPKHSPPPPTPVLNLSGLDGLTPVKTPTRPVPMLNLSQFDKTASAKTAPLHRTPPQASPAAEPSMHKPLSSVELEMMEQQVAQLEADLGAARRLGHPHAWSSLAPAWVRQFCTLSERLSSSPGPLAQAQSNALVTPRGATARLAQLQKAVEQARRGPSLVHTLRQSSESLAAQAKPAASTNEPASHPESAEAEPSQTGLTQRLEGHHGVGFAPRRTGPADSQTAPVYGQRYLELVSRSMNTPRGLTVTPLSEMLMPLPTPRESPRVHYTPAATPREQSTAPFATVSPQSQAHANAALSFLSTRSTDGHFYNAAAAGTTEGSGERIWKPSTQSYEGAAREYHAHR